MYVYIYAVQRIWIFSKLSVPCGFKYNPFALAAFRRSLVKNSCPNDSQLPCVVILYTTQMISELPALPHDRQVPEQGLALNLFWLRETNIKDPERETEETKAAVILQVCSW